MALRKLFVSWVYGLVLLFLLGCGEKPTAVEQHSVQEKGPDSCNLAYVDAYKWRNDTVCFVLDTLFDYSVLQSKYDTIDEVIKACPSARITKKDTANAYEESIDTIVTIEQADSYLVYFKSYEKQFLMEGVITQPFAHLVNKPTTIGGDEKYIKAHFRLPKNSACNPLVLTSYEVSDMQHLYFCNGKLRKIVLLPYYD